MRNIIRPSSIYGLILVVLLCAAYGAVAETPKEITLRDAVALVLANSPDLASYNWRVRAAEAREITAGLRRNPEISIEIEDIRWQDGPRGGASSNTFQLGGTGLGVAHDASTDPGARAGLSETQITLRLAQVVELGGKRVKRMGLAARRKQLAQWDYETARLDVLTHAAKDFVTVLSAQERVALAWSGVTSAEQVAAAVAVRVGAGAVSPLESTRAETQLATARIAQEKAARDLDVARAELAMLWGAETPDFERAVGDLNALYPVLSYEKLVVLIERNPDVAHWVDEMEASRAALEVEQSKRAPDLTVTAGVRTRGLPSHAQRGWSVDSSGALGWTKGNSGSDEDREYMMVIEFGIPLPIFDRNQGGIREAECEAARTKVDHRRTVVHAHAALFEAQKTLEQSYSAAVTLRDDVFPRARDTFERTQEGYRQGKFGYLDVLDAERMLLEVQGQCLDALTAYHLARVDVDRLTGEPAP